MAHELTRICSNITSLKDIQGDILRHRKLQPLQITVLNLHSNKIARLDGEVLGGLSSLATLDLSSNWIEKIEGLGKLHQLTYLNLSNNKVRILIFMCPGPFRNANKAHRKIRQIAGLDGLHSLRTLYLSFNEIKTLDGMVSMHGNIHSLRFLDLKGNNIDDVRELSYLAGCTRLQDLILHGPSSARINPLCNQDSALYRVSVFRLLPNIRTLDSTNEDGQAISPDTSALDIPDLRNYKAALIAMDMDLSEENGYGFAHGQLSLSLTSSQAEHISFLQ